MTLIEAKTKTLIEAETNQLDAYSKAARKIRRVLWYLVAVVAIFLAIVIPAFNLYSELGKEEARADLAVNALADRVSSFIARNQSTWDLMDARLRDIISLSPYQTQHSLAHLNLNDGSLVLEVGAEPAFPNMIVSTSVTDGLNRVGRLSLNIGLKDNIIQAAISSAMGLAVALLCFITFWFFPIRLIDHTLKLIHNIQEEAQNQLLTISQARNKAEAANKAKSDLLANLTHELKTPLNHIIGYSEMWSGDFRTFDKDALKGDLKIIGIAGDHLLNVVNDILDMSKIDANRMTINISEFEIGEAIKEIVLPFGLTAQQNTTTLEVICPDDIGSMRSDPTRFRQIAINFLSNALKFTEQGKVTLEVSRERSNPGDWVTLRVSDTGIGIDPGRLKAIFEPFTQAEDSTAQNYGGSGLGLAICKHLAEKLGGEIGVSSELGKGTTFICKLPVNRHDGVDEEQV